MLTWNDPSGRYFIFLVEHFLRSMGWQLQLKITRLSLCKMNIILKIGLQNSFIQMNIKNKMEIISYNKLH